MLQPVPFEHLFDNSAGPISSEEFDAWHEDTVSNMMIGGQPLVVGWATKILNVYLKTRVYLAQEGRPGLVAAIHPPIDAGLWQGLLGHFGETNPGIVKDSNCVGRIKDITTYAKYRKIIGGCRRAATELRCELIEVEQLWLGASVG